MYGWEPLLSVSNPARLLTRTSPRNRVKSEIHCVEELQRKLQLSIAARCRLFMYVVLQSYNESMQCLVLVMILKTKFEDLLNMQLHNHHKILFCLCIAKCMYMYFDEVANTKLHNYAEKTLQTTTKRYLYFIFPLIKHYFPKWSFWEQSYNDLNLTKVLTDVSLLAHSYQNML